MKRILLLGCGDADRGGLRNHLGLVMRQAVAVDDPWATWDRIAGEMPSRVAAKDRHLYAVGWLRTEVNNGGFHQLFFNSAGDVLPDAIAACTAVGAHELAAMIGQAAAVFGDSYPTVRNTRQDLMLLLSPSQEDLLDELTNVYFGLESTADLDEVMRALTRP